MHPQSVNKDNGSGTGFSALSPLLIHLALAIGTTVGAACSLRNSEFPGTSLSAMDRILMESFVMPCEE
jgi:hypothetical protein